MFYDRLYESTILSKPNKFPVLNFNEASFMKCNLHLHGDVAFIHTFVQVQRTRVLSTFVA